MIWVVLIVVVLLSPIWLLYPMYRYAIKYEHGPEYADRKNWYYATAILDIALNYSILILYVWSIPRGKKELTFTKHIARLKATDAGWRGKLSAWICRVWLDPYGPNGCHC